MNEVIQLSQLLVQALGLAGKVVEKHGDAEDKKAFQELIQKANEDLDEAFIRSAANDAAADQVLKDRFKKP